MVHLMRVSTLKSWFAGLSVLFLTIIAGPSCHAAEKPPTDQLPQAVVVQRIYNFGSIMENTDVRHDFIIENHGSGVLEIQKVKPD